MISGLTSRTDGLLEKNGSTVFQLPVGVYHLVETRAPDGYQLRAGPVVVTVTAASPPDSVNYDDGTNLPASGGKSYDEAAKVYTLKISNTTGYELPNTGSIGTLPLRLGGATLLLTGLIYRFRPRRKRERGDAML